MMENFPTLIFSSKIPYGETIIVVGCVCSNLFLTSRKLSKTVTGPHHHKMAEMRATNMSTRTFLVRSAQGSKAFPNLNSCIGIINK